MVKYVLLYVASFMRIDILRFYKVLTGGTHRYETWNRGFTQCWKKHII